MTLTEFTSLSKNYDALNEEQRLALEKITYRYPYFQAAYALYLKSLKEQEQFNFDLILKKQRLLVQIVTPYMSGFIRTIRLKVQKLYKYKKKKKQNPFLK